MEESLGFSEESAFSQKAQESLGFLMEESLGFSEESWEMELQRTSGEVTEVAVGYAEVVRRSKLAVVAGIEDPVLW